MSSSQVLQYKVLDPQHSLTQDIGQSLWSGIGNLLGHTQVQTTARYAHLARDTVKTPVARIGDNIDNDLVTASQAAFISTDYTHILR